jgi:tetratricopeptide (TPR) repeat protein
VLVSGGYVVHQRSIVGAGIPVRPAADSLRPELADEIAARENAVRGFRHPGAGLVGLSRLYHANGFYREAIQCYETLGRLEPHEARWPHLHASILAGSGRIEEALPLWQRAIALAPDYLPARIRLGDILTKANHRSEAIQAYAAALQREPGNPYALLGLARNDLAEHDWSRARAHLEQAVTAHPDFIGALSLLVTVYEHEGEAKGARGLREVIGRKEFRDIPDPWLDELIGDCYDSYRLSVAAAVAGLAGDTATARNHLERAVALSPAAGSYHRQLGQFLFQQHDYPSARRHLEKAVAVAPDDSDAWLSLVDVLTELNQPAEAERTLLAGLAACPQSAALHYAYGHKLGESDQPGPAITELQTAKKLRPSEANSYIDLALVYFRLNRIEEGVAEMRAALSVQPGHPLAMQVLARHAINSGDEPAARQWIQQLRQQARVSEADLGTITGEYQQHFGRQP